VLNEEVTPNGELKQGDFNYSLDLESAEQDISVENLTVSWNNDQIGGCAELTTEEASKEETDKAISEPGNTSSILAVTYDYSIEANKNFTPPTLSITLFNFERCFTKAKIKATGKFSENNIEEMTFELPFSFSASQVKCTVDSDTKNTELDLNCKIQKTKKFGQLFLEPRLLKKKRQETLFIEKHNFNPGEEYKCENFNELKLKRARSRRNAPFSFLQIARPPSFAHTFFMALMKSSTTPDFSSFTTITVCIIISATSSRMKQLETTKDIDAEVTCTTTSSGDSATLNCDAKDKSINPLIIDYGRNKISGIKDDSKVESNPNPDFSDPAILKKVNKLPQVNITNIQSNNCSLNGSYIIKAKKINDKAFDFTNVEKVPIPFSNPDLEGLCEITLNGNELTINCENKKAFSPYQIIIDSQIVFDQNKTMLFKIANTFSNSTGFAWTISDKSLVNLFPANYTDPKGAGNDPNDGDNSSSNRVVQKSKSGLSGGAIAGIVIACVAFVAIIIIVIELAKKGTSSGAKVANDDNSSAVKISVDVNNSK